MKYPSRNTYMVVAVVFALAWLPHPARANVCPGATVTATALSFGTYDSIAGSAVTSSATITVTCGGSTATPITNVQLNAGLHSAGSFNPRVMQNTAATDNLNYNLFVDSTYVATSIWGDGTSGTQDPGGTTAGHGGNILVLTVFGQIAANQDPTGVCPTTPCTYNDTVTMTINF